MVSKRKGLNLWVMVIISCCRGSSKVLLCGVARREKKKEAIDCLASRVSNNKTIKKGCIEYLSKICNERFQDYSRQLTLLDDAQPPTLPAAIVRHSPILFSSSSWNESVGVFRSFLPALEYRRPTLALLLVAAPWSWGELLLAFSFFVVVNTVVFSSS